MPGPPPTTFVKRSRASRQFDTHLQRYGRWFTYVRTDQRFHCSCWDPNTAGTREDLCPLCLDTGYKIQMERMRAFLSAPENLSALVASVNIGDWGRIDQYPGILYMHHDSRPQQSDLVLDCEWDRPAGSIENGGRITHIVRAWRISALIPVIFNEEAAVDYYLGGMEQHNLETKALFHYVRHLPLITQPFPTAIAGSSYEQTHGLARASRRKP